MPIEVERDSALLQALFWCDSIGNVQMMLLDQYRSKNMNINLYFQNGLFTLNAYTNATTHWLPFRTIYRSEDKVVKVEVPVITNKQNLIQKIFYYIGIIASVAFVTWVIVRFTLKRKISFK